MFCVAMLIRLERPCPPTPTQATFNLSLGGGLGPLMGKVFRIGHLGDLNEPMLLGCLATTELAMKTAGVPFAPGGVDAAIESLAN